MLFSQAAGKGTVVPVTNWARPAPFSRPALCELPLLNAAGQSRVTLSLLEELFFLKSRLWAAPGGKRGPDTRRPNTIIVSQAGSPLKQLTLTLQFQCNYSTAALASGGPSLYPSVPFCMGGKGY